MEYNQNIQQSVTELGNPRKPQGAEGVQMLARMNSSHAAVTAWAFSFLNVQPDDTILDVGCGGGAALSRLSDLAQRGHLVGIDYSPVSVRESRTLNIADVESGKMEIVEGSVEQLPFSDEQFDKVVTVESFYFWPNPVENLGEVRRVLKQGGVFLLTADIYQKDGLSEETLDNIRKYDLLNPTPDQFRDMFRQAGFTDVVIRTEPGTDWICVEGHR